MAARKISKHESETLARCFLPDIQAFFKEAKETGAYEMYYIELATGLRRGELLELKWQDIDRKNGIIKVKRQETSVNGEIIEALLKAKNAYRAMTISQQAIDVLKQQKTKTDGECIFRRLRAGSPGGESRRSVFREPPFPAGRATRIIESRAVVFSARIYYREVII